MRSLAHRGIGSEQVRFVKQYATCCNSGVLINSLQLWMHPMRSTFRAAHSEFTPLEWESLGEYFWQQHRRLAGLIAEVVRKLTKAISDIIVFELQESNEI